MSQVRLTNLTIIHIHSRELMNLSVNSLIDIFASNKKRRTGIKYSERIIPPIFWATLRHWCECSTACAGVARTHLSRNGNLFHKCDFLMQREASHGFLILAVPMYASHVLLLLQAEALSLDGRALRYDLTSCLTPAPADTRHVPPRLRNRKNLRFNPILTTWLDLSCFIICVTLWGHIQLLRRLNWRNYSK